MALIANHHTGPMAFPRSLEGNVVFAATTINPGECKEIDDDIWKEFKKTPVIQFYLDKGHLSEVQDAGKNVVVGEERTSELVVPDHLQSEEQEAASNVSAKVVRKTKGSISVPVE